LSACTTELKTGDGMEYDLVEAMPANIHLFPKEVKGEYMSTKQILSRFISGVAFL
jgi:hypothetical protein